MPIYPILLEQTETEYLLTIHPSQKERTRRIDGRTWDPKRRCWAYPRLERIYNAIVGEFGEELDNRVAQPGFDGHDAPAPPQDDAYLQADVHDVQTRVEQLESENRRYQQEVAQANAALATLRTKLATATSQVQELQQQLASQQNGPLPNQLLRQLAEKDRIIILQRTEADAQHATLLDAQAQLQASRQQVEQLQQAIDDMKPDNNAEKFLLILALRAASGDVRFKNILKKQRLDVQLALELHNQLVILVAGLLRDGGYTVKLYELLEEARTEKKMNEDQLDLAHFIRRQRNIIAHGTLTRNSTTARVLLILFAAALLWPELKKQESS